MKFNARGRQRKTTKFTRSKGMGVKDHPSFKTKFANHYTSNDFDGLCFTVLEPIPLLHYSAQAWMREEAGVLKLINPP